MTNSKTDTNGLAKQFETLIENTGKTTSNKVLLRREASILLNVERAKEQKPVRPDDHSHVVLRSEPKSKTVSRRKPLSTLLETNNSSQSLPRTRSIDDRFNADQLVINVRPVQQPAPVDPCDLRLFIIRHGERVDRYFGPNWFMMAFDQLGHYRPFHSNLPLQLPHRPNKYFWAVDTPLTRDGLSAAQNVGRVLGLNRYEPSFVYSSPASRCVFTAYQILKGLGLENKLAIRIEPGLLELGASRYGMDVFLKPADWRNFGINVDPFYQPIMTHVPAIEREDAYYLRSKYVVRELEKRHHNTAANLHNILLVGHATSPETLTWDLVGRIPNVNDLYTLSLNIGYLQMVITERQRQHRTWALKQMPLQSTTLKWV